MSCCCGVPRVGDMRSYEEALALLLGQVRPVARHEHVALADALGRVLAEPVVSRIDVPSWDNSAMDGYAVRSVDLAGESPRLRVVQRIAAGSAGGMLQPGTAARIFTGAPVPPGADTVVIQESCERDGDTVVIRQVPKAGANIRRAGEDVRNCTEVIAAGTRLGPRTWASPPRSGSRSWRYAAGPGWPCSARVTSW